MKWPRERILRYLHGNTRVMAEVFPESGRPGMRELVRVHWRRGGGWDHLLMGLLVMPTFGLSALIWRRFRASCCFAGFLDEAAGRVGCLIHPEIMAGPDLRRHAFPLIFTLSCNRTLRCPMLENGPADRSLDAVAASKKGYESLMDRGPRRDIRPPPEQI
jgi:hypothetical protein